MPGTPIWIDTRPIWDGDDDWYPLLVENAVVVPSPATDRLAAIAAQHQVWLVVGVQERDPEGTRSTTRCSTSPPSGSWSTSTASWCPRDPSARCGRWATGRPCARSRHHWDAGRWLDLLGELHAAGPFPPLRPRRGRVARTDAGPGRRMGRNDAPHRPGEPDVRHRSQPDHSIDQIPAAFPHRERLVPASFVRGAGAVRCSSPGTPSSSDPAARCLPGPFGSEETLVAELDLAEVDSLPQVHGPVGHYNRPDIFQLLVDTTSRRATRATATASTQEGKNAHAG